MSDLLQLPPDLPVPEDDGACDHLPGRSVPALTLQSSRGSVDLAAFAAGRGVLYVYPRTGVALGPIPYLADLAYDTVAANLGIVRFVGAVTAILLLTVPTAFIIIYLEMKVIALMNLRLGPNRVGPWGTLQSAIHGFKVLGKEDFTPTGADVPVFTLAPAVVYLASVMCFLVLPFAPGLVGADRLRLGSAGEVGEESLERRDHPVIHAWDWRCVKVRPRASCRNCLARSWRKPMWAGSW